MKSGTDVYCSKLHNYTAGRRAGSSGRGSGIGPVCLAAFRIRRFRVALGFSRPYISFVGFGRFGPAQATDLRQR